MLKAKDFEQIGKGVGAFPLETLAPIQGSLQPIYSDHLNNRYLILPYTELSDVQAIDYLSRMGLILNYKGALQSYGVFYVFASVN